MKNHKLFKTGLIGSTIVALCCFTPILVIILTTIGFASLVGYLDYVLLPALFLFIAITFFALVKNSPFKK